MPVIKINETEQTSFAAFDATENTVLIPVLYSRSYKYIEQEVDVESSESGSDESTVIRIPVYDEGKDVKSKLYTDANVFRKEFTNDENFGGFNHSVLVDSELDKSFVMAYELLLKGLRVVVKPIVIDSIDYADENDRVSITLLQAYDFLEEAISSSQSSASVFEEFKDRNIYNLKFITTGGYSNIGNVCISEINEITGEITYKTSSMYMEIMKLAADRGDAIALVEYKDHFDNEKDLLDEVNNFKPSSYITSSGLDSRLLSAAFVPWCDFNSTISGRGISEFTMPGCFAFLMAYANSVRSNANWFAASGVIRGYIPSLIAPTFNIGEALMHTLQQDSEAASKLDIAINPIYNAGTYGYRIWGNRVLGGISSNAVEADKYSNFLNIRVLLCDIKKQVYHSAMRVTFEPNDDIVWINFKTLSNSLLDRMKSGRGISWYKWTKEKSDKLATIVAILTIKPIEAVESFEINIVLTDEEASIEELTA